MPGRDGQAVEMGDGDQLVRPDTAFVDQEGPHLAVPVLLNDKNGVVPVNEIPDLILEGKAPEPQGIDPDPLGAKRFQCFAGGLGAGAEKD